MSKHLYWIGRTQIVGKLGDKDWMKICARNLPNTRLNNHRVTKKRGDKKIIKKYKGIPKKYTEQVQILNGNITS